MSFEEDVDVYGECRNFIKFCKEQEIQVTSEAVATIWAAFQTNVACLLYTSPSPRDKRQSRMPSSA